MQLQGFSTSLKLFHNHFTKTGDRLLPHGSIRLTYLLCQFGIKDLKTLPNQTGCWDVVWNYRACNFMRDMKAGQQPGISGVVKIVKESYVDQFYKKDVHYDTSSKADNPRWSWCPPLTSGTLEDKDPL
uniref:Thymocyte nuclear protein 1 n=1 Tax=Salmo trutta TaxID=8032 RepID=A0A674E776_SALTR